MFYLWCCVFLYCAGAMDRSAVYLNCRKVLAIALGTLPMAGDHYIVIFKFVHDLCVGDLFLTEDDISVLSRHVQWTPRKEGENGGGRKRRRRRGGTMERGRGMVGGHFRLDILLWELIWFGYETWFRKVKFFYIAHKCDPL